MPQREKGRTPMPVTVTEPTPTTGVEITGLSGSRLVDRGVAEECPALPYGPAAARLMHRTSLLGEEAVV
ncbi:hypothetical protein [Streptomyces sp. NPDC058683]|uniref:hypothetical protein n=1 Tax=Streptomyces sp. NPDC058683 TaxID=3346597 RepID=UPI00364E050F